MPVLNFKYYVLIRLRGEKLYTICILMVCSIKIQRYLWDITYTAHIFYQAQLKQTFAILQIGNLPASLGNNHLVS